MPLGPPGTGQHKTFVDDITQRWMYFRDQRMNIVRDTLDRWDLYLTQKREFRNKGEEWRANLALPDAFASVEAKVANLVAIMLSADPIVQMEGTGDSTADSARSVERILDYTYRMNHFPKFLAKLLRARSVAGTAFFKLTWIDQAHTVTLSRDEAAIQAFQAAVMQASQAVPGVPPPDWIREPGPFEQWRKLVNDSKKARVPAPPLEGPQRIVRYRGPKLSILPLTSVYLDPLIDEVSEQNLIIHQVVKPVAWLEKRVAAGLYDAKAVEYAMEGWDGQRVEEEEVELARRLGIITDSGAAADPYYSKSVQLRECWQPGEEYPYALILNGRACINLNPTEMPFLHGEPSIGSVRSTVIPGHFYGISDLTPPADLLWEKRKLRNLRVDAVTLNVLPAYLKLREVGLPEMMHKIRPGALIPVSRPDAISQLVRDPLPPEAYREPSDMDHDIADSMGVDSATKGQEASIGRVTGTEFQGRQNRAQIRFKLDSTFLEEDLASLNTQMVALFAQLGGDPLIMKVGGDPNPIAEISRADLIESMQMQWRFRGPNKAINRDMQVQHLLMWVKTYGVQLTPSEFRYSAKLVLDLLDVRGSSKLVSDQGTVQKEGEYQLAAQAQSAATGAQARAQEVAGVPPPQSGGGQQPPPPQGGGQ